MHFCFNFVYLVIVFSYFCNNLGLAHIEQVKCVLKYISRILDLGL